MSATSEGENGVPKATTGFHDGLIVFQACFFERGEGVCTQDFSPLIVVIASRIPTGKDMPKTT
jgi:hypothetical protein